MRSHLRTVVPGVVPPLNLFVVADSFAISVVSTCSTLSGTAQLIAFPGNDFVMTLSSSLVGKIGTLGTVGTQGVPVTLGVGSSSVLEAVGTPLTEGAPVTSASALVTSAHFTGAEGRLVTSSCRVPTVETTTRDVKSRRLPPIRGQSIRGLVRQSLPPHSLGVGLVSLFWFLSPSLVASGAPLGGMTLKLGTS